MSSKPALWLQKIEQSLNPLGDTPIWGYPPSIPWEALCHDIAKAINLSDLTLKVQQTKWTQSDDILAGFGSQPQIFTLELTPLASKFYWAIPLEDMQRLCSWVMGDGHGEFTDLDLQKGFYQFLLLEAMNVMDDLKILDDLSPKFSTGALNPAPSLTIDISIGYRDATIWGRLICPDHFKRAFASHFGNKKRWQIHAKPSQIPLTLHLVAGKAQLSYDMFQKLGVGDCLLLDEAYYTVDSKRGAMQLLINDLPLFHVKVKEESIKILDYANYHEESPMNNMNEPEDEEYPDDEAFDEDNFDEDEEDLEEEDEDEDGDFSEEEDIAPSSHVASGELFPAEKVPLTLCVEVSRIKMSLEKLLQLSPGSTLELPTHLNQDVNLTLSGVSVARGELIQIGDLLGVKITEKLS